MEGHIAVSGKRRLMLSSRVARRLAGVVSSVIIMAPLGTGPDDPGGFGSSLSATTCTASTCELRAETPGQPASPARAPDAPKPRTHQVDNVGHQSGALVGSPSPTPTNCGIWTPGGTCIGLKSSGVDPAAPAGVGKAGGNVSPEMVAREAVRQLR